MIKILISLLLVITFNSCMGLKSGTNLKNSKSYESFYVGDEGVQYFFKPLYFTDKSSDLSVDFTFRTKLNTNDGAIINFSLLTDKVLKSVDSISFSNSQSKFAAGSLKRLFVEKKGEKYYYRYSANTNLTNLSRLYANPEWVIQVGNMEQKFLFPVNRKAKKRINYLNTAVFVFL